MLANGGFSTAKTRHKQWGLIVLRLRAEFNKSFSAKGSAVDHVPVTDMSKHSHLTPVALPK